MSGTRGFACPREWKERLTSREYETLKAISRKWPIGDERRDEGIVKAAVLIASSMAKLDGLDLSQLYPIPPPSPEPEHLASLEKLSSAQNAQWP